MADVVVIPTGTCNIASVCAAMRRSGAEAIVSDRPRDIEAAAIVVLPGVGRFGRAMQRLLVTGAAEGIMRRAERDHPLLAICVGAQVLGVASEESPGVAGLGILPASARSLGSAAPVRLPQMTWNMVRPDPACVLIAEGEAYFANSFAFAEESRLADAGCAVAWSQYGTRFVAAFERGSLLACQCHPELSGAWGRALLDRCIARFLRRASGPVVQSSVPPQRASS